MTNGICFCSVFKITGAVTPTDYKNELKLQSPSVSFSRQGLHCLFSLGVRYRGFAFRAEFPTNVIQVQSTPEFCLCGNERGSQSV